MKRIIGTILILSIMLTMVASCFVLFTGCDKNNKALETTATYTVCEYEPETHKELGVVNDRIIECYKRYKLVFNVEFNNIEVLGDKIEALTIEVQMDDYENDDNRNHLLSDEDEMGGGPKFTKSENGTWRSYVNIGASRKIQFEKSFFIIGVDSVVDDGYDLKPITLTIKSDNRKVFISGEESFRFKLQPVKAKFDWDESKVITNVGSTALKHNVNIQIPKHCYEIQIVFWNNKERTEKYGSKTLSSDDNRSAFEKGEISLVLSETLFQFVSMSKYNQEVIEHGYFEVYVEFIAVGGKNTTTTSFMKKYQLD